MGLIRFVGNKMRAIGYLIRSLRFYYFFKTSNILIGKNLIIRGGLSKTDIRGKILIYDNVIIEAHSSEAKLTIGANCVFSYGVIVSCSHEISIGDDVWIGEYSSLRDSTHTFSVYKTLKETTDRKDSIVIGNNVWIGKNSLILPGTRIGNNVIIGANSLVNGVCLNNSVYAGAPAVLKKRLDSADS